MYVVYVVALQFVNHGVLISAVLVDTLCEVSSDVIVTVIVVL